MMKGETLLSLWQPLLQMIFSYNFPINMLRAVACCQQLHTALGEKLKAGHKPCKYFGNGCPSTQIWADRMNSGALDGLTHIYALHIERP